MSRLTDSIRDLNNELMKVEKSLEPFLTSKESLECQIVTLQDELDRVAKEVSILEKKKGDLLKQIVKLVNESHDFITADDDIYNLSIDVLGLTPRCGNCLKFENIYFIGELVQRTESQILRIPNLGKKSLKETIEKLSERGLRLGTKLGNWRCPE